VYGRGPNEDKLKSLLKEEINSKRVEIKYVSNLVDRLTKSKIFFSLIEPDNFPSRSLAEALYTGNSIVILNSGKSLFYYNNNGAVIVEKDPIEVYRATKRLISGDLHQQSRNSLRHYQKELSVDRYLEYINKAIMAI